VGLPHPRAQFGVSIPDPAGEQRPGRVAQRLDRDRQAASVADARLVRSMSRKACSPDNAACEGFFGRLKNELFYARNWLATTIDEFIAELDAYVRWYNAARIKMSLGSRSPLEHRKALGIAV
jgi:transposase InsO family protein